MINFHKRTLRCNNSRFEAESPCKAVAIRKADADIAVLQPVKKEAALFLEEDKLRQQKKIDSSVTVAEQIKNISANLERLRQGWMGLYNRYACGEISREAFVEQKRKGWLLCGRRKNLGTCSRQRRLCWRIRDVRN